MKEVSIALRIDSSFSLIYLFFCEEGKVFFYLKKKKLQRAFVSYTEITLANPIVSNYTQNYLDFQNIQLPCNLTTFNSITEKSSSFAFTLPFQVKFWIIFGSLTFHDEVITH